MKVSRKIIALLLTAFISVTASAQIIKWERVYGSTEYEYGRSIQQTIDGGYIVGGTSSSYGSATDMYLLRLNGNGSLRWHKIFGYGNDEWCLSVKQTPVDSGYILCGYTNSTGAGGYDVFLVKTDSLGNELWHQTYGGSDWDFGASVDLTSDGGYIITGSTYSYGAGGEDLLLLKTDASGTQQWIQTFGGFEDDNGTEVHQSFDGGYILSGSTKSFSLGDYDMWIIKTDAAGALVWNHTYGSPYLDVLNSIKLTPDGGYAAAGYTYRNRVHADADIYLLKLDQFGATQFFCNDDVMFGNSMAQSIWPTFDGNYFTVGYKDYSGGGGWDFHFLKWDANLNFITGSNRGGSKDEFGYQGQQTLDSGFVMVGNTTTWGNGKSDIFVVKIDKNFAYTALPIVGTNDIVRNELDLSMNVFPNPVQEHAILSADEKLFSGKGFVTIVDITGREVYRADEQEAKNVSGKTQFKFSVNDLSDGIYLLSLESEAGVFTRKFVVRH